MLRTQISAGLQPIFPPLEPGGDYWDTAFLEAALASLKRRAPDLINQIVLALYAWTYDQPLDWGAGGPANVETLRITHRRITDSEVTHLRLVYRNLSEIFIPDTGFSGCSGWLQITDIGTYTI